MKVTNITEHDDGSATIIFDMTSDEVHSLLSSAILIGLTEGIKLKEEKSIKEISND